MEIKEGVIGNPHAYVVARVPSKTVEFETPYDIRA